MLFKKEQEQIRQQVEIRRMLDNDEKKASEEEHTKEGVIQDSIEKSQQSKEGSDHKEGS